MRGKLFYRILIVIVAITLIHTKIFSQASNFGCETGVSGSSTYVPTFNINLTSSPSASVTQSITIPPSGYGECCGQADNYNCFVLAVTLNSNAQGVQFNLGGASGNASIWYSNCSTGPYNIGYTFCVSGAGPHYFTFCRTGSTDYSVIIKSIPTPSNSGNVITADGCTDQLIAYGLQESSITWNSISPGTIGQYNNYLSNMQGGNQGTSGITYTNQDSVLVTPQPGYPSIIQYQLCGNTVGTVCAASVPYCATVSVKIVPTIGVSISPTNPIICSSNPTITANVTGGQAPFTYLWSGPSNNGATTSSIVPTVIGTYTVTVVDATGCPGVSSSTTVLAAPVTIGTSNQTLCLNQNSIPTSFTSSNINTTFSWTNNNTSTGIPASGTGNLPSYPLTGVGTSTITVTPTLYGCQGASSTFTITVNPLPNVDAGPNQLICSNSITSVTAIGGISYVWSPSVSNGVNFTATTQGNYTVTATGSNGCQNTDFLTITFDNINPTASNPSPVTVQCLTNVPAPDPTVVTDESDNLGTPTVTWISDTPSGSCPAIISRVYRVQDQCGNFINVTQTITVLPSTSPTVPSNGSSTVGCVSNAQIQPVSPSVTDICGNTITPIVTSTVTPICEGTKIWTFVYTDCAGNTSTWTYTYTIDYSGGLIAPSNGSSTVSCPADATDPGAPANITDACGRTVTAVLVGQDNPTPQCEGTVVWRYRYTACDGTTTADWTYTYTIDLPLFTIPFANGSSTVNCPVDAVDPGSPGVVQDQCGNILTPVITAPAVVGCAGGTMDWVYTYTDCAGNTLDWIYSYTIDMSPFVLSDADGSSTVSCPSDAQVQPVYPVVNDLCGNQVIPTITAPALLACEGNMVWTFVYTDCAGNTDTWTYTYTIDYSGGLTAPSNGSSTVSCPSQATDPGAPANITDACGRVVIPVLIGSVNVSNPNACGGDKVWTYRYTACDGTTIADWSYTYTIDDNIPPTASNPVNIIVECPEDIPLPDPLVVIDENDNCGPVTVSWIGDQINNAGCPIVTRTYSISDLCGNSISVTQIIEVQDNLPPAVTLQDTIFSSNGDIPSIDINSITGITDNCSGILTVSFISETIEGVCPKVIDRIYHVTDPCGNTTAVTQTIVTASSLFPVNANFSFNPQSISTINSGVQFLNSSTGANSYLWIFGDGTTATQFEPYHTYNSDDCNGYLVSLIASDGNCVDTTTQIIQCTEEAIFYVPNAFTPDADQYNNTFYPVFTSGFDPYNFEMLIFNRWGELVFESHNVNYGWDGSYQNGRKVQDGVFTWKISYQYKNSGYKNILVGHVTLIR